MITVIGNSHAHFFTNTHPAHRGYSSNEEGFFSSYSLNGQLGKTQEFRAPLAYTFYEKWLPILLKRIETKDIPLQEGSTIVLALGEIDCRVHIPRQVLTNGMSIKDAVESTALEYFKTPIRLRELGYKVVLWGVHPSSNQGPTRGREVHNIPYVGDVLLRNQITQAWNGFIQYKCKQELFNFISIFDLIIKQDGTTDEKFYIDGCHLDTTMLYDHVVERFREQNLIP